MPREAADSENRNSTDCNRGDTGFSFPRRKVLTALPKRISRRYDRGTSQAMRAENLDIFGLFAHSLRNPRCDS